MSNSLAEIDLIALVHNIETVGSRLPQGVKILFVVKADAYGHGIEVVSRVAQEAGIAYLGVSTVDEGARIRRAGGTLPILVLSNVLPGGIAAAQDFDLTLPICETAAAMLLAQTAKRKGKRICVHVNVDTGMHRFGGSPLGALALMERLRDNPTVEVEGVFSHLANAISPNDEARDYTDGQLRRFTSLLSRLRERDLLPRLRHIGNSAGVIGYEERVVSQGLNMVRIGTLLYGYPEIDRPWIRAIKPVATLTAPVIAFKDLAPGDRIGYDSSYRAGSARRIAILPIGYGTGISPQLANRGVVAVNGRFAPIIGALGLNHTTIDVTGIDSLSLGEWVEVFGPSIPADRLAHAAGLSVCELLVPALQGATRTYKQPVR